MASVTSCLGVLDNEQIASFLALKEVQVAKDQIDARSAGSVYFTVTLTESLKSVLKSKLGLDLSSKKSVPMRWIKGDTEPHVDVGGTRFDNTYLMYLTDSPGQLVIDKQSYPMTQGSAYVFPESLQHETRDTGANPRLLFGPMSETGLAVGGGDVIGGSGGTTIFIRQSGFNYETSDDQINWFPFPFPIQVINTNTSAGMLTIEFTTDMTLTTVDDYFVCGSSHIQFGSSSLKTDGLRPMITIAGASNYPGLIRNGSDSTNGYSNIHVFNLEVNAVDGSTLYSSEPDGGGWVGQLYYGKAATNNYIVNCFSYGAISSYGGGIVGNSAGALGGSLTIIGCSSSGAIGASAGGIVGGYASKDSGSVVCDSCWSTGAIGNDAGGITGNNTGYAIITNCYSTGAIGGLAGGICGSVTARVSRLVTITNCYSIGSIAAAAGGIVGQSAGTVIISNCYSLGNMGSSQSGGIMANTSGTGAVITNCYTVGSVVGGQGYIIGSSALVPPTCYSEAYSGAPGTWNSSDASNTLLEVPTPVVGTTWVAYASNEPFELRNMGYTPYTITNIATTPTPALKRSFAASVIKGNATIPAIIENKNYVILQITGGDAGSHGTILILNPLTGVISTTTDTAPGTYTIFVRNIGSYNITEVVLTVTESGGGGGGATTVTCCERPTFRRGPLVDNATRIDLAAGNTYLGSVRRGNIPSFQILAMKKARASKR